MRLFRVSFGSNIRHDFVVADSYAKAEEVYQKYFPEDTIKEILVVSDSVYVQEGV